MSELLDRIGQLHKENPKFQPVLRLKTKEIDGKTTLSYYSKEAGENKAIKPVEGIFLEKPLSLYQYDNKNKCSVETSLFFNMNHKGFVYKKREKIFAGNYKECKEYILSEFKAVKTLQNFIVCTEHGYVIASTNISVGIDDYNNYKDVLKYQTIKLEASLYNSDDPTIKKQTKENLGGLADTNPPKLVRLRKGSDLKEFLKDKDQKEFLKHIDQLQEWKEYYIKEETREPVKHEISDVFVGEEVQNVLDEEDEAPY